MNIGNRASDKFDTVDKFIFILIVRGFGIGKVFLKFKNIGFKLFLFFNQLFNPFFDVIEIGFQKIGNPVQFVFNILNKFFGLFTGNAFNTADTCRNRRFRNNVEVADIAGGVGVGSAAEFAGENFAVFLH